MFPLNPFIDPEVKIKKGKLSYINKPLNKLEIPNIKTLISKQNKEEVEEIKSIYIPNVVSSEKPILESDTIGIEINSQFLGSTSITDQAFGESNVERLTSKSIVRKIPKTIEEVYESLHLIKGTKSGKNNTVFNVKELKEICLNLGIPVAGKKEDLRRRIISEVMKEYKI